MVAGRAVFSLRSSRYRHKPQNTHRIVSAKSEAVPQLPRVFATSFHSSRCPVRGDDSREVTLGR